MIGHKSKIKASHFSICNDLVSNMNQKCQKNAPDIHHSVKGTGEFGLYIPLGWSLESSQWWLASMIFTWAISLKILENLTPVWKCVEIELSSVACLNNLEIPRFIMSSYERSSPLSKAWFHIFKIIKMLTISEQ